MIWLGHGGGGGRGGGRGRRSISGNEMLGRGHIVGWRNTGQEEGILLTVKIHLVKNKRSQRPGCSNWPRLGPAPPEEKLGEIFFRDALSRHPPR